MVVLHSTNSGNNRLVAQLIARHLGCQTFAAADNPDLSHYNSIILVVANSGDEELQPQMEEYLCGLKLTGKDYYLCELGNYFFFGEYKGCKQVAAALLDALGWTKRGETCVDTVPTLDTGALEAWLQNEFPHTD